MTETVRSQSQSRLQTRPEVLVDPRNVHLLDCIQRDVEAGGTVPGCRLHLLSRQDDLLTVSAGGDIALWNFPTTPHLSWDSPFKKILYLSADVARRCGAGRYIPIPFNPLLLQVDRSMAPHLDWGQSQFRLYTFVPPHEIGCIYPLVKAYMLEYRSSDAVSLTIRTWAKRSVVEEAIGYATEEVSMARTHRPRINLHLGAWSAVDQALLHVWGDACILPWAGCAAPLEILYAMAAGNLVAATGWMASGIVTCRTGILLNYELLNRPDGTVYAVPDWEQVAAAMRLAVANGKRDLLPAKTDAAERSCETGNFSRILMSFCDAADD